jgi:DNA-directed RNA polymerase specialized sigma24 family protein
LPVRELIRRCAEDDRDAWERLLRLVEGASTGVIRQLCASYRLDLALADDAMQEMLIHLWERSAWRLRAFRGSDPAQFQAYLARLCRRFLRRRIARWHSSRRREAVLLRGLEPAGAGGPSEPQVRAAYAELLALMTGSDRRKLAVVLDRSTRHDPISERTARRWAEQLQGRYAGRLA